MFHIKAPGAPSPTVFSTSRFENSESEAREWFERTYKDGTISQVRKGKPFTKAEEIKERDKLKYS
jgi:hypothetical protein